MDNQHKHIKGYRDLTEHDIARMNEAKAIAETVGQLINKLGEIQEVDARWLAIAKTDLQKGFMSLVRAIAQPTTF